MAENTTSRNLRVEAAPEKLFFISMLVKDIELLPAIVDLVDNSVDGARSLQPMGHFQGHHVDVTVARDTFIIEDNCGGIEVDTARKYAFRFGRPKGFIGVEASVGQFGVGMKRALFKIGDRFRIESVANTSRFTLEVDVVEWAVDSDPDWSFQLESAEEKQNNPVGKRGTKITVTAIHPSVGDDLAADSTVRRLATTIALQHQSAIAGGLRVSVNGYALRPAIPKLLLSASIKPINHVFRIPVEEGEVEVRLVAGIAQGRDRDTRDDDQAEDFPDPGDAGWYIFCNNRLVLAADKSRLTGWGVSTAAYHPQYRRFRGYVYFYAKDSSFLPWNTTKTGLDQDSSVFRAVQQEMYSALSSVAVILNRQKTEVQTRDEDDRPLTIALDEATETDVATLPESDRYVAPPLPPQAPRTPPGMLQVNFKATRQELERAMEVTGLSRNSAVGRHAFDYFYKAEVEDS